MNDIVYIGEAPAAQCLLQIKDRVDKIRANCHVVLYIVHSNKVGRRAAKSLGKTLLKKFDTPQHGQLLKCASLLYTQSGVYTWLHVKKQQSLRALTLKLQRTHLKIEGACIPPVLQGEHAVRDFFNEIITNRDQKLRARGGQKREEIISSSSDSSDASSEPESNEHTPYHRLVHEYSPPAGWVKERVGLDIVFTKADSNAQAHVYSAGDGTFTWHPVIVKRDVCSDLIEDMRQKGYEIEHE